MRVWFVFLFIALDGWADSPQQLYKQAKKAEKHGDILRAYALYTQASFLDPKNPEYEGRSMALRGSALGEAKVELAPGLSGMAPDVTGAIISDEDLALMKRLTVPAEIKGAAIKQDFALTGSARELFEKVTKAYGLDVVFDGDYDTPASGAADRAYTFTLTQATWQEALHVLQVITNSFLAPLSDKLLMVVRDTPQKRTEQEPNIAVMVPIPEGLADAVELARSIQQVMELQKFAVDTTRKTVYMRGPMSKVKPAIILFNQLAERRGQVVIEVELYEALAGSTLDYGIGLPTASKLLSLARLTKLLPPVSAMGQLLTFGGGSSLLGIGVIDAQLFASMSMNQSNSKLKAEMRTIDNFPASLIVGDKYPIITQQFISDQGAQTTSLFSPPPTIQFEDLGLTLKITPRVHNMEEISLDVESEFKVLTGQSLNGIPIISTRKYQGKVRLREGEWAIVAGLVTMTDTNSRSGIPIVSAIPGIGSRSKEKRRGHTLLVIRPRLVTAPASETATLPLWVGPESKLRTLF